MEGPHVCQGILLDFFAAVRQKHPGQFSCRYGFIGHKPKRAKQRRFFSDSWAPVAPRLIRTVILQAQLCVR